MLRLIIMLNLVDEGRTGIEHKLGGSTLSDVRFSFTGVHNKISSCYFPRIIQFN